MELWDEPWGWTTAAEMAVHWDAWMVEMKVARKVSPKAAHTADTWAYWSVDATAAVKAANWERWMVEPMECTSAPQWDSPTAAQTVPIQKNKRGVGRWVARMGDHLAVPTVVQTADQMEDQTADR